MKVLKEWGLCSYNFGLVSYVFSLWGEIFFCSESICVLMFKIWEEVEVYMDVGKYVCVLELDCEFVYDVVWKKWVDWVGEMYVVSGDR